MTKILNKMSIKETYINIMKFISNKPTVVIILNGEMA